MPSIRTPFPTLIASSCDVGTYPHPAATPHLLLFSHPLSHVLTSLFLPRICAASGRLPKVPPFPSASGGAHNNLPPISPYSFLPVCLLLLLLCIICLFLDVSIPLCLYLCYILVFYTRLSSSRDRDATSLSGSDVAHFEPTLLPVFILLYKAPL